MAGFGGAVKLTGESEYRKAIQQITDDLAQMSKELKTQAADFTTNSGNMRIAEQQQKELSISIEENEKQLKRAKNAYAACGVELEAQKVKNSALTKEYRKAVSELYRLAGEVGTTSQEYLDQEKIVNQLSDALAESNASMNESKNTMSALKRQIDEASRTIKKTTIDIENLGESTEESGKDAENASKGFTVFKGILANLGTQVINSVVNGLKTLGNALVNVGKQAVGVYSEYEQLEGGVKKIFGDDVANEVIANANVAFKTAGMSANDYLDTVTSFSATLMQGLGENTDQAARYADTAIRNMADNANTFGTDMASIQNAYQGFAKQNYTMLDNLKLGYGGTASEMARLVNESGVLGSEMKVTAQTVKEIPFYQLIEAIDKTQERMGIMGTTTKEAAGTIQGATGSMQAAWKNLLKGLVDENSDFEQLTKDFIGTLISEDGKGGMIGTLIPRISTVITGISKAISTLLPNLIDKTVPIIMENIPVIVNAVETALQNIVDVIPSILPMFEELISQAISVIVSLLPKLVDAGVKIVISILNGIKNAIPSLLKELPNLITGIVDTIANNLSLIIDVALQIVSALAKGLIEAIPVLVDAIPEIISALIDAILSAIPMIIDCGVQLLTALVDNLPAIITGIVAAIPLIVNGIVNAVTNNIPMIVNAGFQLFMGLIGALPQIIVEIVKSIPDIVVGIFDAFIESVPMMFEAGVELIKGLWEGIKSVGSWLWDNISGFCSDIVGGICDFFGISSPSKLFRDKIGKNLALGIGEGFTDEMQAVSSDMIDSIPKNVSVQAAINDSSNGNMNYLSFDTIVDAFKEALSEVKIEIDDDVAGSFVEKTVTRLVYS